MNLVAKATEMTLLLFMVSIDQEFSKGSAESLLRFHSEGGQGW